MYLFRHTKTYIYIYSYNYYFKQQKTHFTRESFRRTKCLPIAGVPF